MRYPRPGFLTAFGILNIIFGCLFMLCSAAGTAKTTVTINNQDKTQEMNDFMNREVPSYTAMRMVGLITGLTLAGGYILGGIGLLNVASWGRIVVLVCAGLGSLHQLGMGIYQLAVVNPAMSRFLNQFPSPFGFFGIIPQVLGTVTLIAAFIAVTYNVILIIGLLSQSSSRAFAGLPPLDYGRYEEEDDDWDDRPRRPTRRRPARDEEDDEDEPEDRIRKPSRRPPPRDDDDEPPRRRPSRPRPRDEEEDEDEDDRRSPRRRR